jgi:hypothetical protein
VHPNAGYVRRKRLGISNVEQHPKTLAFEHLDLKEDLLCNTQSLAEVDG